MTHIFVNVATGIEQKVKDKDLNKWLKVNKDKFGNTYFGRNMYNWLYRGSVS